MRFISVRRIVYVLLVIATIAALAWSDLIVSARQQQQVINELRKELMEGYVDAGRAKEMDRWLAEISNAPGLLHLSSGPAFAAHLDGELASMVRDAHLHVIYRLFPEPLADDAPPSPQAIEEQRRQLEANHFGFRRVEILRGNIGYIQLDGFAPPSFAADTLAAAMDQMEPTRALILDLRENHGGSPYMGLLTASYFFEQRVHWVDLHSRNETEELWTSAAVKGKRFVGKPVYILTSRSTFSAGEGFSYHMKNLKRATIVGEATGGGANPGEMRQISRHFFLFLPTMRAVSPITGTNWETVGVQPDVPVPAEQAMEKALVLIGG